MMNAEQSRPKVRPEKKGVQNQADLAHGRCERRRKFYCKPGAAKIGAKQRRKHLCNFKFSSKFFKIFVKQNLL